MKSIENLKNKLRTISFSFSNSPIDEYMEHCIQEICALLNADFGLFVYCNKNGILYKYKKVGLTWHPLEKLKKNFDPTLKTKFDFMNEIVDTCTIITDKKRIIDNDVLSSKNLPLLKIFKEKICSYIAYPLKNEMNNVIGEIFVGYKKPNQITSERIHFFKILITHFKAQHM